MRWTFEEYLKYQAGKGELVYFDTLLIPSYQIQIDDRQEKRFKELDDFLHRVQQLEDRLKGRMILLPAQIYYIQDQELIIKELNSMKEAVSHFKYIVFAPFDQELEASYQEWIKNNTEMVLSNQVSLEDWVQSVIQLWNK